METQREMIAELVEASMDALFVAIESARGIQNDDSLVPEFWSGHPLPDQIAYAIAGSGYSIKIVPDALEMTPPPVPELDDISDETLSSAAKEYVAWLQEVCVTSPPFNHRSLIGLITETLNGYVAHLSENHVTP